MFLSLAFRLTNRGGSNHRENKQTLRRSREFRDASGARSYSELSLVYVTLTACRHACSGRDTRTIESPTARKLGPADYYVHTPVIIISASGDTPLCNYEHRHGARNVGATKRRRSGGPHDRVLRAKCQFTCDKLGRRRRRFRCVVTTSVRHAPVAPPPVSDSSPWFAPSNPINE